MICRSILALAATATIGFGLISGPAPALAQSDQWNALYDRIIRLEHQIRGLNSGGAGAMATTPMGDSGYRLTAIEDQLRQIAGQMQDLRRAQQDLEFRLEQLEGGVRSSGQPLPSVFERQQTQAPQAQPQFPQLDAGQNLDQPQYGTREVARLGGEGDVSIDVGRGAGPQVLGTITESQLNGQSAPGTQTADQTGSLLPEKVEQAALDGNPLPSSGSADGLYGSAYESLLGRRFGAAEAGFKLFLDRHGDHQLAGDAQYWLGETYYVQGDYKQAAQSFLKGYRSYPKGRKGPETLFKLALSLQHLGQKPQACSALAEVAKEYPTAANIRNEAIKEMKRAGC